jgi:hypothetical protein
VTDKLPRLSEERVEGDAGAAPDAAEAPPSVWHASPDIVEAVRKQKSMAPPVPSEPVSAPPSPPVDAQAVAPIVVDEFDDEAATRLREVPPTTKPKKSDAPAAPAATPSSPPSLRPSHPVAALPSVPPSRPSLAPLAPPSFGPAVAPSTPSVALSEDASYPARRRWLDQPVVLVAVSFAVSAGTILALGEVALSGR